MSPGGSAPIVALLTDFGLQDPFVGIMKAVVLGHCPEATLIDVTHGVPPQDVAAGAFWLERSHPWFPPRTVFIAVVDPGVGSARDGLVVEAHGKIFVGPDNGLLGGVAASDPSHTAHAIDGPALGLPAPSRTFHGRDVFAPVAARLAAGGLRPSEVGPRRSAVTVLAQTPVLRSGGAVEGSVVTIDHFGNAITTIPGQSAGAGYVVEVCDKVVAMARTYSDVEPGELVALINAFGMIEVARRDGSAAAHAGIVVGSKVVVRPARGGGV